MARRRPARRHFRLLTPWGWQMATLFLVCTLLVLATAALDDAPTLTTWLP